MVIGFRVPFDEQTLVELHFAYDATKDRKRIDGGGPHPVENERILWKIITSREGA